MEFSPEERFGKKSMALRARLERISEKWGVMIWPGYFVSNVLYNYVKHVTLSTGSINEGIGETVAETPKYFYHGLI
jgi:hypothetical protein